MLYVHDLLQNNAFILIILYLTFQSFQTINHSPINFLDSSSFYIFEGHWIHFFICLHINSQGIAIDITQSVVVRRSGQVVPWRRTSKKDCG